MSSFDGNDDDDDVVDIVSARPIQKQEERKHGTVPSAGIPLPSFDFLSPIGKPKMREPGPLTSTPRVAIANPRPLTTYGRGHDEDKLPNITENSQMSHITEALSKSDLNGSGKGSERNAQDLAFDREVDRSRSICARLGSPCPVTNKNNRHAGSTKNLCEQKWKAAWGCPDQDVNPKQETVPETPLVDKLPSSPMQTSTVSCASAMQVSKENSIVASDKAMSTEEGKKAESSPSFLITTSDDSVIGGKSAVRSRRTLASSSSSSSSSDVEKRAEAKNPLYEVEDVVSSTADDSVHISSTSSIAEVSNHIEECNPAIEEVHNPVVDKVSDASSINDVQIVASVSPLPSSSLGKPAQTSLKRSADLSKLPDGGKRLSEEIKLVQDKLNSLGEAENSENVDPTVSANKGETDLAANSSQNRNGPPIIPPQAMPDVHRLFGGKMTDERICIANAVTGQVIAQMHNSLANTPENVKTETPAGLRTELMPHQQEGLTWLLWREKQSSPGGILADDMGLGKTLSMISLIVYMKEQRKQNAEEIEKWRRYILKDDRLVPSKATLIIAPASLIYQWEAEIEKHVKSGRLSRILFHGPKNKRDINPQCLAQYDVVITTYGIVSSELAEKVTLIDNEKSGSTDTDDSFDGKKEKGRVKRKISKKSKSVLAQIGWERVILDEAHQIKNKTSLISRACCKVPAAARWCLTGTPIHNNLWDLYSLIRFLRVAPFDEEAVWKEYILSRHSSSQRLNTLVKGLLLRREKNQLCPVTNKPIVNLKPKMYEKIDLKLEGLEKKIYDYMFQVSRQQVKELIKTREERERELYGIGIHRRKQVNDEPMRNPFVGGPRMIRNNDKFQAMTCVLTLLMRLRQACVHLALVNQAVDTEAFETLGVEEDEDANALSKCLSNMSLLDQKAFDILSNNADKQIEQLFENTFLSTKIKSLLGRVDHALSQGDKCVIVSQWTSLLDIVGYHLKQQQISYTSITGKVLVKDRQNRADSFNTVGSGPQVMLLSLTAGGVGLNLIGGNHLFLVDLHWNPALEQQACDRIYRMGQKKNVFVHKLVCLETIEERVLALQQIKQALAKGVLEGAASKKLSKLTVADLKYLFDLGRPRTDLPNTATDTAKLPYDQTTQPSSFVPASSFANKNAGPLAPNNLGLN